LGQRRDARQAYKFGAQYQTSFYGQLAAERISLGPDASLASQEQKGLWRSASFLRSNVFKAGLMLHYADQPRLTRRFFAHMAETMSLSDQTALAALALEIERPHVALRVAKEAAKMGRVIPVPYYPVTDLATFGVDIDPELAMAIARQESELDPEVVSPAGARGLMQVMPGTARIVAGELGLPYSRNRLTSDWRYNARLGQAYLAGLLEDFGGSYVLASAGYNAGPNRVRRWIQDYGTPGDATVDVVDWIETIPFRETRNYVMRILESLHVYRARINGQVEPIRLAQDLRSAY
jgi:soluble lytic murein transglycosylase